MITKIGDVCSFINGDRSKNYPSSTEFIESGIPFINAGHIENQRISFDNMNYISEKKYNSLKSGKVKIGDVLFCLRGSLGKNAVIDFENDAAIASSLVIIRPNQSLIKSEYISLYFNSLLFKNKLMKLNNGSSQPNLSAASIKSIEISVPDMKKQNEIINKLLVTKELIDKQMEELELLNELVRARFVEMFGDPVHSEKYGTRKLSSCVAEKSDMVDGPFGSQVNTKVDYIENGEIPVIRTVNVKMMSFSPTDLKYMTREKYETVIRSQVLPGDVILTKVGTIGNVCIFPNTFDEAVLSTTGSCRIRVDNSVVNTQFFAYNLMYLKGKLLEIASAGVQPFLNMNHVKNIDILDVSLEKQKEFADFVKEVDKSRSRIQKSLEASQELFDSLMQEYFG